MKVQRPATASELRMRHISKTALTHAQLESIARWVDAVITHPTATEEQLDVVYDYVSNAPLTEIAKTVQSLGY
jgi:hypothetical protein